MLLSPAKNIFKFMSRSKRLVECSRLSYVMMARGVGMNLSPVGVLLVEEAYGWWLGRETQVS